MEIDIHASDFNKTLAPWIGKTSKMMNIYVAEVFHKNKIQVTKEQWIILKILHDEKDGIVQNELALLTYRNKASLARLITGMEKNKLVVRKTAQEDARKNQIFITQQGKQLFLTMKPLLLRCIQKLQEGISEEEMKSFIKIMSKIQYNLKNQNL